MNNQNESQKANQTDEKPQKGRNEGAWNGNVSDENESLASDGPVSKSEGAEAPDLNDTSEVPTTK